MVLLLGVLLHQVARVGADFHGIGNLGSASCVEARLLEQVLVATGEGSTTDAQFTMDQVLFGELQNVVDRPVT